MVRHSPGVSVCVAALAAIGSKGRISGQVVAADTSRPAPAGGP